MDCGAQNNPNEKICKYCGNKL
ncbi:MAG: zinc-ribbon domain-containing protein [Promethearchaeota archaeon]